MLFRLGRKAGLIIVAAVVIFGVIVFGQLVGRLPWLDSAINTISYPVMRNCSWLISNADDQYMAIGSYFALREQVEQLKAENQQLKEQMGNREQLLAENQRLHAMLQYNMVNPQFKLKPARVIGRDAADWSLAIVIDCGSSDGVVEGMPVITPQGLVGNVERVFPYSARVRLLTERSSAVSAIVQRAQSRVAGIVEGDGGWRLKFINLPNEADVVKGDRIITSGFSDIYPGGLNVGEVVEIKAQNSGLVKYAMLKPAVDLSRLEEVEVIISKR